MRRRNRGGVDEARRLLQTFHSRSDEGRLAEHSWGPHEMWAVGSGVQVLYSSDKIDPGDPSDRGGVWKGYFHDQDPDTLVYLPPAKAKRLLKGGAALDRCYPEWPEAMTWLGSADGYTLDCDGRIVERKLDGRQGGGLQLWGFPCMRGFSGCMDLVAAPATGGREGDAVLWCGPNLTIDWPGIDG